MKNLFLYAKYFAMEEDAKEITMDHIIKAVENMDLGGGKMEKDILKCIENYIQKKIDDDSFGSLF